VARDRAFSITRSVMDKIGVVGCGLMGAGIAEVCARAGSQVIAVEASPDRVEAGIARITKSLERAESRGRIDSAAAVLERISVVEDINALRDRDLVIEAIVEDEATKVALFSSSTRSSSRPRRSWRRTRPRSRS